MKCQRCNFSAEDSESRCPRCDNFLQEKAEKKNRFNLLKRKENKESKESKDNLKAENKFADIANAIFAKASLSEELNNEELVEKAIQATELEIGGSKEKELENSAGLQEREEEEDLAVLVTNAMKETENNIANAKELDKKDNAINNSTSEQEESIEEDLNDDEVKDFNVESLISLTNQISLKKPKIETTQSVTKIASKTELQELKERKIIDKNLEKSIEDLISSIPEIKLDSSEVKEEEYKETESEKKSKKKEDEAQELLSKSEQEEAKAYEVDVDKELDLDSLLKEFE